MKKTRHMERFSGRALESLRSYHRRPIGTTNIASGTLSHTDSLMDAPSGMKGFFMIRRPSHRYYQWPMENDFPTFDLSSRHITGGLMATDHGQTDHTHSNSKRHHHNYYPYSNYLQLHYQDLDLVDLHTASISETDSRIRGDYETNFTLKHGRRMRRSSTFTASHHSHHHIQHSAGDPYQVNSGGSGCADDPTYHNSFQAFYSSQDHIPRYPYSGHHHHHHHRHQMHQHLGLVHLLPSHKTSHLSRRYMSTPAENVKTMEKLHSDKPNTTANTVAAKLHSDASDNSKRATTQTDTEKKEVEPAPKFKEVLKKPSLIGPWLRNAKNSIVSSAKHLWSSSKLFAADVRVSWRIVKRMLQGKTLSRREKDMLVRTGADIARIVPFSMFIIIPFMEFALPFALKLFPNMLPSQFQDKVKKEDDMKRQLKLRLEVAQYLQNVVAEKAKMVKASSEKDVAVKKEAEELQSFLESIRKGEKVDEDNIFRFARFFSDELTIENAVRAQLVAMCKYMNLSIYGSDSMLRFSLQNKISRIKSDDMEIMWEGGVEALSDDEVEKACRDRGIKTFGVSKRMQRRRLQQWLEMSQNREVPASLMILSRSFFYNEQPDSALKETLSSLPEELISDVKSATLTDSSMTSEERLEEMKRQERILKEEAEQRDKEEAAEKEKKLKDEAEKKLKEVKEMMAAEEKRVKEEKQRKEQERLEGHRETVFQQATMLKDEATVEGSQAKEEKGKEEKQTKQIFGEAQAPFIQSGSGGPSETPKQSILASVDQLEEVEDQEAVKKIVESLKNLYSDNMIKKERLQLEALKSELRQMDNLLQNVGGAEKEDKDKAAPIKDMKRIKNMIAKIDSEFVQVEKALGVKLKLLDSDQDGVMSIQEVTEALNFIAGVDEVPEAVAEVLRRLDVDGDGKCTVHDLRRLVREVNQRQDKKEESL